MSQFITLSYFPETKEQNAGSSVKVPGIKAIRAIFGIGLKEAKEVIENLQDNGTVYTDEVKSDDPVVKEALESFVNYGGKYQVDDALAVKVREAVDLALDKNKLDAAIDLINILKTVG